MAICAATKQRKLCTEKKTITELLSITLFLFSEVNWNEPENEATT